MSNPFSADESMTRASPNSRTLPGLWLAAVPATEMKWNGQPSHVLGQLVCSALNVLGV